MIEFATNEYLHSHGRLPRGRGHWAFEVVSSCIDQEALKRYVDEYNNSMFTASHARLRIDSTLYPGKTLLWTPTGLTFKDSKLLAKHAFQRCVSSRVGLLVNVAT